MNRLMSSYRGSPAARVFSLRIGFVLALAATLRLFRLTKAGRQKFQQCLPRWKRAEEQLLGVALAEVTRVSV
jgi:hypothetical protein